MENPSVVIIAAVAVLAIAGLVLSSTVHSGAVIARPMVGDECVRIQCADGEAPAKIKDYNGYVYCACGTYHAGPPPEKVFEYELSKGRWISR